MSANSRTEPYITMFAESSNELFWSTYYGTNGSDETSTDIEVGGPHIVWTGSTNHAPQPSTISNLAEVPTSWQQIIGSGFDGIIAKFNAPSNIRIAQSTANGVQSDYFDILPNLADHSVTIINHSSDASEMEVEVKLLDISGRLIQEVVIKDVVNNISVPEINSGIYVIQLNSIKGSECHKVPFINN